MPPPVDPANPSVVPSPVSFFGDNWHSTLAMLLKLRINISQTLQGEPPGRDSPRKIPLASCIPPRIVLHGDAPKSLSLPVVARAAVIASSPAHGPTEWRWELCERARCEQEHSSAQRYAPPLAYGSPPMTAGVQAPSLRG